MRRHSVIAMHIACFRVPGPSPRSDSSHTPPPTTVSVSVSSHRPIVVPAAVSCALIWNVLSATVPSYVSPLPLSHLLRAPPAPAAATCAAPASLVTHHTYRASCPSDRNSLAAAVHFPAARFFFCGRTHTHAPRPPIITPRLLRTYRTALRPPLLAALVYRSTRLLFPLPFRASL